MLYSTRLMGLGHLKRQIVGLSIQTDLGPESFGLRWSIDPKGGAL